MAASRVRHRASLAIALVAILLGTSCSPQNERAKETVDVRMPNGTLIRGVPKGTSRQALLKKLNDNGYDTAAMLLPRAIPIQSPTFLGYPCTEDCSGHQAGYDWAEENVIDDPDDCGGSSQSFYEGCVAYAEEQVDAQSSSLGEPE